MSNMVSKKWSQKKRWKMISGKICVHVVKFVCKMYSTFVEYWINKKR